MAGDQLPGDQRLGIAVHGGTLATVAAAARRAEERGFESVWTTESYDRSATVSLAAMAQATSSITLASGIAYAVGRSPLVLATEARDLDELSGGRLLLGLGTGNHPHATGLARCRRALARPAAGGVRRVSRPRMMEAGGLDIRRERHRGCVCRYLCT